MSGPQRVKFYQTGTFTVGNRLLDVSVRSVQSDTTATTRSTPGTARARGAARRWAHATPSTPRCGRSTAG
jgi:hypothetical protein